MKLARVGLVTHFWHLPVPHPAEHAHAWHRSHIASLRERASVSDQSLETIDPIWLYGVAAIAAYLRRSPKSLYQSFARNGTPPGVRRMGAIYTMHVPTFERAFDGPAPPRQVRP